ARASIGWLGRHRARKWLVREERLVGLIREMRMRSMLTSWTGRDEEQGAQRGADFSFPLPLALRLPQRVVLLEGWKKFEEENGTEEDVERVQARMPQVTKRWRKLDTGDMEEYWDILFADDEREANPATYKFIQNALAWRNKEGGGKT
ncbi:2659_t:CDS:2, partial [Acaulospora colombiana]